MVAAIGAIPTYSAQVPTVSTGGLRAELARYEKALSECVNCATAQTTEGQQEIQRLSSEIARLKARIEAAGRSISSQTRDGAGDSSAAANSERSAERMGLGAAVTDGRTVGGRIDILA
jgi:hypothetical protein